MEKVAEICKSNRVKKCVRIKIHKAAQIVFNYKFIKREVIILLVSAAVHVQCIPEDPVVMNGQL